jgi:hypothetical protein
MSDTSSTLPDTAPPGTGPAPIELHWMKVPNVEMHEHHGVSAQALCGTWMEPDQSLAEEATRNGNVRYVSCRPCDKIHALHLLIDPS